MSTVTPDTSPTVSPRFAVIGAGAAGLCAAKYLLDAGFADVTIFEIGTQIGGLWCYENDNGQSSAYITLHINTPRSITSFHDHPFPPGVQMFPDHRDMHAYLVSYAERFDLVRRIRFKSRVVDVRPVASFDNRAPQWTVKTDNGQAETFDRVIVASGHLAEPRHVPEFRNDFAGQYLHTHDYRTPAPYVGKRVCVVGSGNSACDIASDICMTAERTVLVARSGVIIAPKLLFGIPYHDIKLWLNKWWIPAWVQKKIASLIIYALHGSMEDLGFKLPKKRVHGTSNAVLVQHIAYRRITVKQGIERIGGKRIYFPDGSSEEFDVLLAGTGYVIDLPFIARSIVPTPGGTVELYKRIVSPSWPGLYFIGLTNSNTSLPQLFEHQMQWLIPFEKSEAMFPPADEMLADIEARQREVQATFENSPRHSIEEPYEDYFPALTASLRTARERMRRAAAGRAKPSPFEEYANAIPAARPDPAQAEQTTNVHFMPRDRRSA